MKNKLFIVILTRSETLQEIATLDIFLLVFDLKNTVALLLFSSNGKKTVLQTGKSLQTNTSVVIL